MPYWIEIRPAVRRSGPPRLVPLEDVGKYTGFRSVFAYNDEVADLIREQGGTHQMRGLPVYADTLFVDFDNSDGSLMIAHLQDRGIGYQAWHSGGRSVHIHIPLEPIFGAWVPAACKAWVRDLSPDADLSFYHPAGVYRLPHTFHPKHAGRMKHIQDIRPGSLLQLKEPTTTEKDVAWTPRVLAATPQELTFMATEPCKPGQRRPHAWRLAVCALECGHDIDVALEILRGWNGRFCVPPHTEDVLQAQVDSAATYLMRKHK